jgi:glycine cleavage system H protein
LPLRTKGGLTILADTLLLRISISHTPSEGDEASAEDEFCVVESVKAASGVYAPADLEVVEVNEALDAEPELVIEP